MLKRRSSACQLGRKPRSARWTAASGPTPSSAMARC